MNLHELGSYKLILYCSWNLNETPWNNLFSGSRRLIFTLSFWINYLNFVIKKSYLNLESSNKLMMQNCVLEFIQCMLHVALFFAEEASL